MEIDIRTFNLSSRLKEIVQFQTNEYRRFKQLENMTSIQADTWKSWFHARQRPTVEMIEAVGKLWPQYAFWLMTGLVDERFGHVAPEEFGYPKKTEEQKNSSEYFKAVRNSYTEARNVIEKFWIDELGNTNLKPEWSLIDDLLREPFNLNLPQEVTAKLFELKKLERKAERLRQSEVMLNLEIEDLNDDNLTFFREKIEQRILQIKEIQKSLNNKEVK